MAEAEVLRRQGLDAAAAIDEMLRERQERLQAGELSVPAHEPPKQVERAPEPPQREEQQPMHHPFWDANQKFIEQVIDQHVGPAQKTWFNDQLMGLASGIGEEIAAIRKQDRELLRGEFKTQLAELRTEFDRRLVELQHRAEVAALEQRLAEAEQRSAPKSAVRLIGHSDAAD